MSINSPFPYTFNDPQAETRNQCGLFKLRFGVSQDKYLIFKGLKIANTVENLSKQIHRERNMSHPKEDSILYKVLAYLRTSRVTIMHVEVLKETDDVIDLLMSEYEALQAAKKDENCLNTKFFNNEYFPQWIPQTAVNEFNRRLQGAKATDTDKNLMKFLNRTLKSKSAIEKVFKYVKEHYKPGNRHNFKAKGTSKPNEGN